MYIVVLCFDGIMRMFLMFSEGYLHQLEMYTDLILGKAINCIAMRLTPILEGLNCHIEFHSYGMELFITK